MKATVKGSVTGETLAVLSVTPAMKTGGSINHRA